MKSWREEKKERTRRAIADAALARFAADGYDAVTVADVARVAEVGERTVYRYFVDKEELLFADDTRIQDALAAALSAVDPAADPLAAMRVAAATIAGTLDDQPNRMRQRAALVAATPDLQARERVKQAGWQARLAEALTDRGVPAPQARLYGAVGVACFVEALSRWLTHDDPTRRGHAATLELGTEIDRAFADIASLAAARGDE